MNFKLLDLFFTSGCCVNLVKNGKQFSKFGCVLQSKGFFCSQSSDDDSKKQSSGDDFKKKKSVKELLDASSPLRTMTPVEGYWATNPYPKGTVFNNVLGADNIESKLPPELTSVIMFPGQGNQFVGMANKLKKYDVVKDMFAAASEILGYDLLKLCCEGPEEKLNETEYCQPATLVCSLAALEKLKDEKPWAINKCVATCGYSLGEFSALVFAGCINFERAVKLVKVRAKAMQLCCNMVPGGMMTVLYGPGSDLKKAIKDAREHCNSKGIEDGQCSIASYLFPGCKVIAGHIEALNYIVENSQEYKLRKLSKLPVSGAFHTDLMREAVQPFKNALDKIELQKPIISVYSNVNGYKYFGVSDIRKKLPSQIYKAVKWEQTMHNIFEREKGVSFPFSYECGPGNSLSVLLKKINQKAYASCSAVKL